MASEMSKVLRKAVNAYTEEIERKESNKIQIALSNTMKRVEQEVDRFLDTMARAYYSGYDPVSYIRTMQLQKKETRPVNPEVEINKIGNMQSLYFGVVFDEVTMNHGSYEIRARWYDKKKKQWKDVKKSKKYTVTPGKKRGKKPDEEKILDFYKEGIHPNAVPEGMTEFLTPEPLFTSDKEGAIPDLITEWVESGELKKIFLEELKKLY
jgi:hypothetical protein